MDRVSFLSACLILAISLLEISADESIARGPSPGQVDAIGRNFTKGSIQNCIGLDWQFTLQNKEYSWLCLAANGSTALKMATCDGNDNSQLFVATKINSNSEFYTIKNQQSGNCLNVEGAAAYYVQQAGCNSNSDTQRWKDYNQSEGNYWHIYSYSYSAERCLTVYDTGPVLPMGAPGCGGGSPSQLWYTWCP